jgi:hypothetical protein
MEDNKELIQDIALSTSKVLAKSDIKDVKNVVGGATDGIVYEIHRQVIMSRSVMWIERSVSEVKEYIKWAWAKFVGLSVLGGIVFGICYYYFKLDLLKLIDRWGILGHVLFGVITLSSLTNLFDFFLLETLFWWKIAKEPKYTLLVDFYTYLRLSVPGGAGVWLTINEIQSILYTRTKREYHVLELTSFINGEPYIINRKNGDKLEYLLEKVTVEND